MNFTVGLKKAFLFLLLSSVFLRFAQAQFYETGQDPFSVSWKQIKTKNFRLIFPAEFEKNARAFAAVMDTFYPVSSKYLLKRPKPVSVLFHTQSSLSNGLVVYAPKRMELYTIPPQDNYPQDWLDQLALHETRHVVQLDALNQGITKAGRILIGEQAVGAVSGLVPRWFLEGDAVYSETIFSSAGRGRSAAFLMPYRTMVMSKPHLFPYEKALLGSYKDFVPDIYQMGYPVVKMMRDSFDKDIFGKSLQYTARNPYLIFPFGHSLEKTSGRNNRYAYEFTYSTLKDTWKKADTFSTYKQWPVKTGKTFTNYNLPVPLNDSLLLAEKWSLAETRHYSLIDINGKEKKLLTVGSNNADKISVYQDKFCWSENKTDIRWQNRTYSEVMVFDMKKKKLTRLTKKTWYFSPAYSPDGKFIAVVEETPQYESALVILDASTGKVIKKTGAPQDSHLQYPLWNGSNEILCLSVGKGGKSIVKLNAGDIWETVLPASFKNISSFRIADSTLIISGENDGINNLFVFHPSTGNYRQITHSRFGAFEPFLDTNKHNLFFTEYTSGGYRIVSIPWTPENYPEVRGYNQNTILPDLHDNAGLNIQSVTKDSTHYTIKNYSKLSHLFKVHSWLPLYYNYSVSDISNPNVYPGFIVMSQDLLGTMLSSFGYSFEEGYSHLRANFSYKAMLPVISWSINSGGPISRIGGSATVPPNYSTDLQSTVTVSLPLNLSRSKLSSAFTPYIQWEYSRDNYYVKQDNKYYQGLNSINWGVNYYLYTKMAQRDMYPRLGFSSYIRMQTTPFENHILNNIAAFSFRQYLPGLFKNHSFQVRYAYQHQDPLRYLYSSMIAFPAGYSSSRTEELHLAGASYALPLVYPDIHMGPVFYLKRIRANIFYDVASNKYHAPNQPNIITHDILRSVGTDVIADVHFLRIMFPFQIGGRIAYLPNEKSFFSQAIFSVNLVY